MVPVPLFEARILRPLIAQLERRGAKVENYLSRARIPVEVVMDGGPITKWQQYRFLADIVQREGREAIFSAHLEMQFADLGPLATAMSGAKTVKEALDIAIRLAPLAYHRHQYALRIEENTAWLCFRDLEELSAGHDLTSQLTLAAYLRVLRSVMGDDLWCPELMCTPMSECHAHAGVPGWENCRVLTGRPMAGLAFPAEFLQRRLAPNILGTETDSERSKLQLEGSRPKGFIDSLTQLITGEFSIRKIPTVEGLAHITGLSRRTIQRRLQESGITYQHLIDRIRFDAACTLLVDRQMNVKEISRELGYSGTNNFVRGFRRLTGVTPGEYRQTLV